MLRKAAVIIGVDRPGDYTPLKSAASGAEEVAKWLTDQGYDVTCLTDKNGPVTAQDAKKAIRNFVTQPPRYHMLVVYFSGHGEYHARADHWLFSHAPTDTDDAINLEGAMDLAKYSGIPNVVFISDACRSLPNTLRGELVQGIDAFPNYDVPTASKIDYFKATSESLPAFEGKVDGENQGFLTYALKSAYITPPDEMMREVQEGGVTFKVVPNRKLEQFLQTTINDIIATKPGISFQRIDVNVPSADDVYISRVIGPKADVAPIPLSIVNPLPTIGDAAADAITRTLSSRGLHTLAGIKSPDVDDVTYIDPQAVGMFTARLPDMAIDHLESQCGFTLHGAHVVRAVCTRGTTNAWIETLEQGNGVSAVLRLWDVKPAVTVAVEFANGKCGILPALAGYIGHAVYESEGLANVSFVPSSNHPRYSMYLLHKAKLDRLRAMVSLAVTHNTFKVGSEHEALALADEIRPEKAMDPTLGLYAAHAFSQAGNDRLVLDVLNYMRDDLNADLFDIQLLASRLLQAAADKYTVPFCPILTQAWNLLRPRGRTLPAVLTQAMPHLCNSLWTTFQPAVTQSIIHAIETGELQ
ncbi:MAG: caspase family protein [Deltaproteobacteria bacterium]|nr:caspase family protein [Deltaproteobacteria bacterium]